METDIRSRTLLRVFLGSMSVLAVLVAGLLLFVKGGGPGAATGYSALAKGELTGFVFAEEIKAPPATAFENAKGEIRGLEDWRGKVVLLNFWATWCAPCLNEMPTLDRLRGEMASDEFDVVAVSVDRAGVEKSAQFLARTEPDHLELWVDKTLELNYNYAVYQLPTTLLIGRDGKEIGRIIGDREWDHPDVKRFLKAVIEETRPQAEADGLDQGSSSLSQ